MKATGTFQHPSSIHTSHKQPNEISPFRAGLLLLSCQSYGQTARELVDYLSIPGPINVQKKAYQLTWSSHPDASLYKQEYLAVENRFPKYKSMIMIDFILTATAVGQAVSTKIRELEALKASTISDNANVLSNNATGEKMIDCLYRWPPTIRIVWLNERSFGLNQ